MESSVIREFLVSLGYEVNGTQERAFVRGVEKSTKVVAGLGVGLTALVAGTVAATNAMEKMFFASQRSQASVRGIQAMQYAVADLGGSADGALNTIESIARFMREKPGGESWIKALGVQTRDANGEMRDTSEIMADIGARLAKMPYYRAARYAQVLGIDEKTLIALRSGVGKFADEYKRMAKAVGYDSEGAAKTSHGFMVQLRGLGSYVDILGKKFFTTFAGTLTPVIEKARRWIEHNGGLISRVIDKIVQGLAVFGHLVTSIITRAVEIFGNLADAYRRLDPETQGFLKGVIAIVAIWKVMNALFAASPIGRVITLGLAILALFDDYKTWKEGGKSLIDWKNWKTEIDLAVGAVNVLIEALKTLNKWRKAAGDAVGGFAAKKAAEIENGSTANDQRQRGSAIHRLLQSLAYGAGYDPRTGEKIPDQYLTDPEASAGPRGIRNNNPGNLNYAGQRGASLESGPNARFAAFGTPQAGLNALAQQLSLYGSRGTDTINAIVAKYAPASENDTGAYAASLAKALGVAPGTKLNLQDPSVMQGLMRGIVSHENGQNPYSSDMYRQAAATTQSRTLQQETNINIYGAKDPRATGQDVARRQDDVNRRAARNLAPAAS